MRRFDVIRIEGGGEPLCRVISEDVSAYAILWWGKEWDFTTVTCTFQLEEHFISIIENTANYAIAIADESH